MAASPLHELSPLAQVPWALTHSPPTQTLSSAQHCPSHGTRPPLHFFLRRCLASPAATLAPPAATSAPAVSRRAARRVRNLASERTSPSKPLASIASPGRSKRFPRATLQAT